MPFEFVKVAQFTTSPLKGKLLPLAQREITISYSPNQLGRFTEQLELIVAGGLKRVPIRLSGTSRFVFFVFFRGFFLGRTHTDTSIDNYFVLV